MQRTRGGGGVACVQCEKVERYYVEEVIRKLKKRERGKGVRVESTSCYLKSVLKCS